MTKSPLVKIIKVKAKQKINIKLKSQSANGIYNGFSKPERERLISRKEFIAWYNNQQGGIEL